MYAEGNAQWSRELVSHSTVANELAHTDKRELKMKEGAGVRAARWYRVSFARLYRHSILAGYELTAPPDDVARTGL